MNTGFRIDDKVRVISNQSDHGYTLEEEYTITSKFDDTNKFFMLAHAVEPRSAIWIKYVDLELIDAPTKRESEANILRRETIPLAEKEARISKEKHELILKTLNKKLKMLEKYDTEEKAQAATIAGVLKSGGDEAAIEYLMDEFKSFVSRI